MPPALSEHSLHLKLSPAVYPSLQMEQSCRTGKKGMMKEWKRVGWANGCDRGPFDEWSDKVAGNRR